MLSSLLNWVLSGDTGLSFFLFFYLEYLVPKNTC